MHHRQTVEQQVTERTTGWTAAKWTPATGTTAAGTKDADVARRPRLAAGFAPGRDAGAGEAGELAHAAVLGYN